MKLMLVDDEQLIREGLAYLLTSFDDIQVVGQAANGQEAIALCHTTPIDVILMDIRMPVLDGVEATESIKKSHPHIRILMLTTFKDDDFIKKAIQNGASGYLLKNSSPKLIHNSLQTVYNGGIVLDEEMTKSVISSYQTKGQPQQYDLVDRELQMIQMMADGLSNKEIGDALFLTEGTVKNTITKLLAKLDLKDRTQVVSFAFRKGFIK